MDSYFASIYAIWICLVSAHYVVYGDEDSKVYLGVLFHLKLIAPFLFIIDAPKLWKLYVHNKSR